MREGQSRGPWAPPGPSCCCLSVRLSICLFHDGSLEAVSLRPAEQLLEGDWGSAKHRQGLCGLCWPPALTYRWKPEGLFPSLSDSLSLSLPRPCSADGPL